MRESRRGNLRDMYMAWRSIRTITYLCGCGKPVDILHHERGACQTDGDRSNDIVKFKQLGRNQSIHCNQHRCNSFVPGSFQD